jgi:L-2-hydroxyglutarate oxidase LhgO
MTRYTVVVGGGVLGLACGAEFARRGRPVLVLEAAERRGSGISSRNSEVVHAGLYYPTGSSKARHCVRGRQRLYAYCAARGVAHRKCGKLIVATSQAELLTLERLATQGTENSVEPLQWLDAALVAALEPAVRCLAAISSPQTGIVDSEGLMSSLTAEIEAHGGALVTRTPVQSVEPRSDGTWELQTGGDEPYRLEAEAVVNAAGLGAWALAQGTGGLAAEAIPPRVLAKGNYFSCGGASPFSRLIYPAPVEGGLGIHATLDLAGRLRFGPDVEWVESESYNVDPARAAHFYKAIRRYWPALPEHALAPDYAGVRPKLSGPGEPAADFLIQGPAMHGLPGLVNLFGIESPGLTSALSIAEEVADLAAGY